MAKITRKKKAKQKAIKAITRLIKAAKELAQAEAEYFDKKIKGDSDGQ
jgi:hypothetical protein